MLEQLQKAIPDDAKLSITDRIFWFLGVVSTSSMAFFNNNSEGIQAFAAFVIMLLAVFKFLGVDKKLVREKK